MTPIRFTVLGDPIGKGRPRFTTTGGRARTYTPARTAEYEKRIASAYKGAGGELAPRVPLVVEVEILKAIPTSAPKNVQKGMREGFIVPDSRPDLDNVLKAVMDGLNGTAWQDDSQVTSVIATQGYADMPMVRVSISEMVGKEFRKRR